MIDRPRFRELHFSEIDQHAGPEGYDLVQLKMDGIWGCMVISFGEWTIYSRTGKIKAKGSCEEGWYTDPEEESIILGEYMKGSHWGHKMDIDGEFFAFDCLKFHDKDIKNKPYTERLDYLKKINSHIAPDFVSILPVYPSYEWNRLWDKKVCEQAYEGLVFKRSNSGYEDSNAWARLKSVVEIEYMCIGMEPADPESKYAGQAGAVIGSLVDKVCAVKCGGLTEEMRREFTDNPERYIGQVFTAKGNGWFPSGAIRHPKFKQWRDDKEVDECIYTQIPEIIRES